MNHCESCIPLVGAAIVAAWLVLLPADAQNCVIAADLPRPLWRNERLIGSPDPPPPLQLARVFPTVQFDHPLFLIKEPTSNRLLVVEQQGKILALSLDDENAQPQLYFDTGRTTYSLCFHPDYAANGLLYVFTNGEVDGKKHNRISRFRVSGHELKKPDPASETIVLEYPSAGHDGHHVMFGPEGLLYITSGDGTTGMDPQLDGQDISNLRGGVLRIDVDHPGEGRQYSIPPDNPFIDLPNARPEFWAFGMRNPFRMAFDPAGGQLWVADIGQDSWEMIYHVERGGNYGWSVMEGSHPLNLTRPRGPAPIRAPIVEHPHSEMRSITGGYFYQGNRFPEFRGAYLYGDYDTGRIFAVRYDYDQRRVTFQQELADTSIRVLSIGPDQNGEPLIVDYGAGGLYTLRRADPPTNKLPFATRLSETGLFSDVAAHQPHPGLIAYSVNSPLWSDGAEKERFIALPGDGKIDINANQNDWRGWTFPQHTVLVKTFSLPVAAKDGATNMRRIETRLLTLQTGPQGGEWVGYTYRWNDEQTDAELVERGGRDETFQVRDEQSPGGVRDQVWRFPSRAECMSCHTREARYALGLTTLQMNRTHDYADGSENQLSRLARLGALSRPLPAAPETLPRLPDPHDSSASLNDRARSYLHANCSQCHTPNGGGNSELTLDYFTSLARTGMFNSRPEHQGDGLQGARLIAPGEPQQSLLVQRINRRGKGQMPPLASSVVDERGAALLTEWVRSLQADE